MEKYPGLFLAIFVLAADALPFFLSLILSWDTTYLPSGTRQKRRISILTVSSCALVQLSLYLLLHNQMQGNWNVLVTFWRIATLNFPYQAISYFPISLGIRLAAAFVTGFLFRLLLSGPKVNAAPLKLSGRRSATALSLLLLCGTILILTADYHLAGFRNIQINEVGSYNTITAADEYSAPTDYIELYNSGRLDFDTTGMYLSDDAANLQKHPLPSAIIPPKGYLVVHLDSKQLAINKDGGETIFLTSQGGAVADQIATIAVEANYAYSRESEASNDWRMLSATPGITNTQGTARLDQQPVFSHASGFYEDPFLLEISAMGDVTIHYTLDGSIPTADSPRYTQPIWVYNRSAESNRGLSQQRTTRQWQDSVPEDQPVDKAFILRAVAVDRNGAVSKPVTATYFVGLAEYRNHAVVSLVADPEDLWGDNGIYVTGSVYDQWYLSGETENAPLPNFWMQGKAWERPAYFEYLSEDQSFGQEIGLRISGGSSRDRADKPFTLYAREEYSGTGLFQRSFWENIQSKRVRIRGGYANSICQLLVPDRHFGTQLFQRVSVFVNGEFLYQANIIEKYDTQYFSAHFGVNPNNVVILNQGCLEDEAPEDAGFVQEIYDYLQSHDLSDSTAYAGFGELVDLQSYIDYMCFNIYIDNMDFSETINAIWWRSREKTTKPYEDGKWRFLLNDLDAMEWDNAYQWGVNSKVEKNTFALKPHYTDSAINQQPIFAALKNSPDFVRQFALTFMDMVNTNFQYRNVQSAMDAFGYDLENYLPGNAGTQERDFYEDFFQNRASYIVPYMAEEFGLTGTLETLTLRQNDPSGGTVILNTTKPDLSGGEWTGQYYTDYPVTVTAVPREGYIFAGWEGSVTSRENTIQLTLSEGGAYLHAIFEKAVS